MVHSGQGYGARDALLRGIVVGTARSLRGWAAAASALAALAVAVEVDDLGVGAVGVDGDELGVLESASTADEAQAWVAE